VPTLTAKTWNIERAGLLNKLTETDWLFFKQHGSQLSLQKNDCLYPIEEEVNCVYVVTQGFCKLMTLNPDGKRFSISILKVGDFIGNALEESMLESGEQTQEEFLEAVSDCQVLRIASRRFAEVLSTNPQLTLNVLQNYQGKTRLFQRKLSDLLFKDVHARIAQLFLELLFDYGEECRYAFGLQRDICLRHHEIAELVGASRPVTSLALGDLLKADLVHKHDGFICLNDLEALKDVAEGGAKVLSVIKKNASAISC
jgi:CRP/FNR family transcriptional regulator, cyclic AMP receptor protein